MQIQQLKAKIKGNKKQQRRFKRILFQPVDSSTKILNEEQDITTFHKPSLRNGLLHQSSMGATDHLDSSILSPMTQAEAAGFFKSKNEHNFVSSGDDLLPGKNNLLKKNLIQLSYKGMILSPKDK